MVSCFDGTASAVPPHVAGSRPEALSAQFSITRAAFSSRPSTSRRRSTPAAEALERP